MDNATHAFAGLLMADATCAWIEERTAVMVDKRLRRVVVGLGIIAAEFPDADLLYSGPVVGMGKLGYLLHHRGHTHTIVFAIVAALLLWWGAMAIHRRGGKTDKRERLPLLMLALGASLSHILLDFTNSYGVHPFWPFDNRWVYGDAVFIVEPWLWVAAIPPLLFGPRRWWSRILLSLLLVAILLASWTLGEMPRAVAVVVLIGAVVWLLLQWWIPAEGRTRGAVMAWILVEVVFFASSAQSRLLLQDALRETLRPGEDIADLIVSPGAGSPLCFDALVVTSTSTQYQIRAATVAPWAAFTSSSSMPPCLARGRSSRFGTIGGATRQTPRTKGGVTWTDRWSGSRAAFHTLAASRCEARYALGFMRAPVWEVSADSTMRMSDVRFGTGGGFSDLRIAPGPCPLSARVWIPPWTPPRGDILLPPSSSD